jgi:hypothetical protein
MTAFVHSSRTFVGRTIAKALNLFLLLRDAFIEAHQTRSRIEAELFRGRYRHSSKNDDDLPIVR